MQIIPAQTISLIEQMVGGQGQDSEERASFMDELLRQQAARQSVNNEQALSVQNALQELGETRTPLSQAPYSRNTVDGVTYSTEEVCFTKQELNELYQQLDKAGAPQDSLQGLATLAQQPDGATLGQVVASLYPAQNAAALSADDENAVRSLSNKIDATGALGDKVIGLLQQGKGEEAWKQISTALSQLSSSATIRAERSEMATLGKLLGLSTTAQQQLLANFGQYDAMTLPAADFDRMATPIENHMMLRRQNREKLEKALDSTLQPLLSKARQRTEKEKAASERSSRRSEQSKVLIKKTVTQQAEGTLDDARTQTADANVNTSRRAADAARPTQDNAAHASAGRDDIARNGVAQNNFAQDNTAQNSVVQDSVTRLPRQEPLAHGTEQSSAANAGKAALAQAGKPAEHEPSFNKNTDKDSGKQQGWEALLNKTEVRQPLASGTPLAATAVFNAATAAQTVGTTPHATVAAPKQALSQVEQAMLTAMRDGTKKLEIQLNPVDLGTLTLTLTSRNGEVSATIRSERGETADMLTRQLDVLRTNLEQQGVKIDKLEVQNQAADNRNSQWDSTQQHNARQEEYARRETLDRLRTLGRVRNNEPISESQLLEQGVQSTMRAAGNAAQSIYIVA